MVSLFDKLDKKILIIFLVCLGNVVISFNVGAVAAAIPLISQDLQLPDVSVARMIAFYMIPYGFGALLYAPLTRFVSYRLVLIGALAVYAFFNFMTATSISLENMLLAQVGAGIAAAASTPLGLIIIGDLFERDVRGRLIGVFFGSSFAASMIGMIFMAIVPWRWLFIIPGILAAITAILFSVMPIVDLDRRHLAHINYLRIFSHKNILKVFVFIFLMSFLYHGLHKWYGVYLARDYGLGKHTVSAFLIIAACCGLAGQNIGGYLTDKKGRMFSCFAGGMILALGAMALFFHYPVSVVPIILGAIALGWTVNHNSVSTVLTDMEDRHRPIIASLNSSIRFVSGGLGFSLTTFFVEKSFSETFLVIGVLFLILVLNQRVFFEN